MAGQLNKANSRQSKRCEGYFKWLKDTGQIEKNRERKMLRTLKRQPNNRTLALRLESVYGYKIAPSPHVVGNEGFEVVG